MGKDKSGKTHSICASCGTGPTCTNCNGTGRWLTQDVSCGHCGGSGRCPLAN